MQPKPAADAVHDTEEWVRRCHRRLSALRPQLVHLELIRMSEDMSRRAHWRRMPPEAAANQAVDPPQARQPRSSD